MKKLLLAFLLTLSVSVLFSCGGNDGGAGDGSGTGGGTTDTGSGDTGSEGSGSGDTGSEGSGSGDTGSEGSGSGDTGSEGSGSGDTGSEGSGGSTVIKYTVTWKDEMGNLLSSVEVSSGTTPSYTYTKTDTDEWDYTVNGWSLTQGGAVLSSIPAASENVTYYASVSKVKKQYTVVFDTQGGSAISSVTVDWGTVISAPTEKPTYQGHKFMGWSSVADEYVEFDFSAPVVAGDIAYAIWNEVVDIKALLNELLDGYELSPYSYIPEAMLASYAGNLVDPDDVISDYSSNVLVDDVLYGGFGEQWNMIITNLNQSQLFFNVLGAVETVTTTSLAAFNNYLDSNPDDTARHNIASGIYSVTLDFDGEEIYFVIDYTATLPALGEQTVQIALSMNAETKDKTVRIQIGDANALTYSITENSYEFAIKYLGVRRAFFSVGRDEDGNVVGQIYEHLSYGGVGTHSSAIFYVIGDYVYAVGNKADALLGFTGYICEVYDKATGKLVGYEVKENFLDVIDLNTLWFNIADIDGIESIRYTEASGNTEDAFYVNGSSDAFEVVKVGFMEDTLRWKSRKFDIEFRTQYFYYYDTDEESYVQLAVKVPMFFVQEDDLEDVVDLMDDANGIEIEIKLSDIELDAIMEAYDLMVPAFSEVKDLITEDVIVEYIGDKVEFENE